MVASGKWASSAAEKALGIKFKDKDLLRRALTHASARGGPHRRLDNERLEFLGDRVLGLAIAERLWRDEPRASEGELARKFNSLVRRETCAGIARSIGLGQHLLLAESEISTGGRDKDTILADAVEAVLGAAFVDQGFDRARELVLTLWRSEIEAGAAPVVDAKSALQEWAQGTGAPLPHYVEVRRHGPDHAPTFVVEVRVRGLEPIRGEGPSKRLAEQAAARALLEREGVGLSQAG
ncbi:MAG: ribonuclease III [Hyphomicrobiaceae bacterium]